MRISAMLRQVCLLALFATTACTQTPARVDIRGQDTFGRSATNTYANNAPATPAGYVAYKPPPLYTNTMPPANVSNETAQAASLQSIGVSELPAPASTRAAAA